MREETMRDTPLKRAMLRAGGAVTIGAWAGERSIVGFDGKEWKLHHTKEQIAAFLAACTGELYTDRFACWGKTCEALDGEMQTTTNRFDSWAKSLHEYAEGITDPKNAPTAAATIGLRESVKLLAARADELADMLHKGRAGVADLAHAIEDYAERNHDTEKALAETAAADAASGHTPIPGWTEDRDKFIGDLKDTGASLLVPMVDRCMEYRDQTRHVSALLDDAQRRDVKFLAANIDLLDDALDGWHKALSFGQIGQGIGDALMFTGKVLLGVGAGYLVLKVLGGANGR